MCTSQRAWKDLEDRFRTISSNLITNFEKYLSLASYMMKSKRRMFSFYIILPPHPSFSILSPNKHAWSNNPKIVGSKVF